MTQTIDLGKVIGPTGPTGPKGDTGPKGPGNVRVVKINAKDINDADVNDIKVTISNDNLRTISAQFGTVTINNASQYGIDDSDILLTAENNTRDVFQQSTRFFNFSSISYYPYPNTAKISCISLHTSGSITVPGDPTGTLDLYLYREE